jgi:tetratricopeptide (TPR) repeat protein
MVADLSMWKSEMAQAQRHLDRGNLEQALVCWNKAVASSGGEIDASAYELHGTILLDQYRSASIDARDGALLDRAAQSYERAAQLDPERDTLAVIYLGLGRTFHDQGLMDRAAAYFEKAIALAPENGQLGAECYYELGAIEAWHHYRPREALPLFQLALDTSPLEPPSNWLANIYWNMSHILVQMGKPEDAITMGNKSLEVIDPNDIDHSEALLAAHKVLGWAHYHIPGHEDRALEHYHQALELETEASTYLYLGHLYFAKDQFRRALEMFQSALDIDPLYEHPGDIYYALGTCLAVLKQHRDALVYLQKAREEQSTVTFKPYRIYKTLGWSYWYMSRYEEATEAFKTALGLMHPKDREYRKIEEYLRKVQARVVAP